MEITPDQKALLESIDPDIELAFLEGVTQSGDFLPALPQYDKIQADMRPQGRKGILSTFAAFAKRVAMFKPTVTALSLSSGCGDYNTLENAYHSPGFYQSFDGTVHLVGMVLLPTLAGGDIVATLPAGFRPPVRIIVPAAKNGAFTYLTIHTSGAIQLAGSSSAGQWLSLHGINFIPA